MRPYKELSLAEAATAIKELDLPAFRARQIAQWVYGKGVASYDEMTNLSRSLRERLAVELPLYTPRIVDRQISQDGTRKYIVAFHDGASTEMVAMPYGNRLTVCFSTQVGCAMQCSFCATGKEGFTRNLVPGEMVDQIILAEKDMGTRVSNVVSMGQGEPLLNLENLSAALEILNDPAYRGIGARHIVVSTCGIVQGIRAFADIGEQYVLAVSLHSAIQETRDMIMPRVANQPIDALIEAIQEYDRKTHRRVTFEYVLIQGMNDDRRHIDALIDICRRTHSNVNLIELNEIEESPFRPSVRKVSLEFVKRLKSAGIEATIRDSRGSDIAGACGQLKNERARLCSDT